MSVPCKHFASCALFYANLEWLYLVWRLFIRSVHCKPKAKKEIIIIILKLITIILIIEKKRKQTISKNFYLLPVPDI